MVTKSKLNPTKMLSATQKCVSDGKATLDLPRNVGEIFEQELYKEWNKPGGGKFDDFLEALTARQPHGLGIGQYHSWITASQLWALCTGHGKLRKELLRLAIDDIQPIAKHGTNQHSGGGRKTTSSARGAEYLLAKLKRKAETNKRVAAILDRLRSGELTSVRQAAIRAGIIKVADSDKNRCPVDRIKMYWKRASAKERRELLKWLRTAEAKQKRP